MPEDYIHSKLNWISQGINRNWWFCQKYWRILSWLTEKRFRLELCKVDEPDFTIKISVSQLHSSVIKHLFDWNTSSVLSLGYKIHPSLTAIQKVSSDPKLEEVWITDDHLRRTDGLPDMVSVHIHRGVEGGGWLLQHRRRRHLTPLHAMNIHKRPTDNVMKDEAKDQLSTCGWIRIKLSSKASSVTSSSSGRSGHPGGLEAQICNFPPIWSPTDNISEHLCCISALTMHLLSNDNTGGPLPSTLRARLVYFCFIFDLVRSTFLARTFKLTPLFFFIILIVVL